MSLQEKILFLLSKSDNVDSLKLAEELEIDHEKIVGAVKSLQAFDGLIQVEQKSITFWELTNEGKDVAIHGSHEIQVYQKVPPEGIALAKLMQCFPDKKIGSVGFSKAMAAGWLSVDKTQKEPMVRIKLNPKSDVVKEHLKDILDGNSEKVPLPQKLDYKKRKLILDTIVTCYIVHKGDKFSTELQKDANDLTVDMLSNGLWKKQQFKPYNFNALGTPPASGHLHPLLKVRAEIRKIFLEMGFKEMPTNNYVESSFWNFDALFQPQQHPARDAHDTFFISDPATSKNFPKEYMERVKKVHSKGGYGSQGYGYDWKEEEASKNLLRTHTTAVSARMLYQIAQEGFHPAKYFSIDKVFRNETLDATHLAEFHQVEGVIADYNLNLGCLIGTLAAFFKKLGISKLEFKPAYNPYTEPSMEIFGYHEGLGKMMEVGNSGIFRPEMLLPMGLPENVTVIAWGLSLERPTMIKYGINNIRDLVGPKVDLKMVYDNPLCRLDKGKSSEKDGNELLEQRGDLIISQTQILLKEVKFLKTKLNNTGIDSQMQVRTAIDPFQRTKTHKWTEVVVFAPPVPPFSLLFMTKQLNSVCRVEFAQHSHSSVGQATSVIDWNYDVEQDVDNLKKDYKICFIWKKDMVSTLLASILSHGKIIGEVNILRYFSREYEKWPESKPIYEKLGLLDSIQIDEWLDRIHIVLMNSSTKVTKDLIQKLENHFQYKKWLVGSSPCVADIALWSAVQQCDALKKSTQIKTWFENLNFEGWFL